ncbi:hypothetical protein Tco_0158806 [Tanacetum coccineum]
MEEERLRLQAIDELMTCLTQLQAATWPLDRNEPIQTLESRYVHERRTIDPFFYNDISDDSVAKFTAIGFDCLLSLDEQICPRHLHYSDAWGLDELEKTLEQIDPYNSRLLALNDIRNLIHRRTVHEKIDKEGNIIHKLPN